MKSSSEATSRLLAIASLTALAMGLFVPTAQAQIISHVPNDLVPPVVKTPAFQPLVPGGAIGTAAINFGVDYTLGNVEGIFDNGGGDEGAISGVNEAGRVDLLAAVDGRIVVAGTATQGLTDFIFVEAGFAGSGNLLLEVFDINGALLDSAVNGPPPGPHNRRTMTIDRGGAFDIASFRVSTPASDTFGVDQVDLETPIPEDSDNDGIPDDEDACPDSDLLATVVIDGCDSGVANLLFEDGCTMADMIADCAEGAVNHGQFVSCVALLTIQWRNAGLINGQEMGNIESCAAIPGDLDGDGAVGVADLVMLLGEWGPCSAQPGACPGDIDVDGIVGITDLLILLGHWGRP